MKKKMKLKVKERLEDVKEFILNNKVKVITISSLILMLIVATVVYIMITNEDTDTVVEYGDFEEITKVDEPEEVLLDVNTDGLQEGEEVAIITDEETGKVTIVSTSDPKFEEKTAGKTVTKGKVTSEGVKVNKDDSNDTIIDIATKPKDEQEENVVIEPPVKVPEEKPTEDDKNNNKDDNKDDNKPTDDDKNEGNSGSTSGNTGNSGSSSGSSDKNDNKPSKPADDDKDEKPSKPSKPADDDKDEKPSKDPTPTGEFIYKHNSSLQSQIKAQIEKAIENDELLSKWGATIKNGTAGKGHGFTYRGLNAHDWASLVETGTNYVYVVDIYCVYSDGSTVKTGEVEVYIYQ